MSNIELFNVRHLKVLETVSLEKFDNPNQDLSFKLISIRIVEVPYCILLRYQRTQITQKSTTNYSKMEL
jgi:hypothetical protein